MCCATRVVLALVLAGTPAAWADVEEPSHEAEAKPLPAEQPLPKQVDLRPRLDKWGLGPRSQGHRGTCSVFATTGALEFAFSRYLGRGTPLSVEYLNWACNQVIHNRTHDRGQFFHHLLQGFQEYGVCFEPQMPYAPRFDPQLKPSPQAIETAKMVRAAGLKIHWINPLKSQPGLTDQQFQEIKQVLAKGYPVAAGAGHSRLLVGYADDQAQPGGGVFYTKDSGSGRYATVTYEFVRAKVIDVFWVEAPARG